MPDIATLRLMHESRERYFTTDKAILRQIMRADPDGGEFEPTERDYAEFERWAIEAFGQTAWDDYRVGGWDDDREW